MITLHITGLWRLEYACMVYWAASRTEAELMLLRLSNSVLSQYKSATLSH